MDAGSTGTVGRTYTKGRRQPYLIRKWPGSNWALPLGPYTVTQLLVFVGSVYLLLSYRHMWAKFGGFNLLIGVGLPLALTYASRHTRIEGRDPLRAGVALVALLLQPRAGYLGGGPWRRPRPVRSRGGRFPIADPPPAAAVVAGRPGPRASVGRPALAELVTQARRASANGGRR